MKNKRIIKFIQWVWVIAIIVAGFYYLYTRWSDVAEYFREIQFIKFLLSFLFFIIGKLFLVFLTKDAVLAEGGVLSYKDTFIIYSQSQLAKYLPGGIWHFVARVKIYNNRNLSLKKSGKALILESIWLASGAAFFCLIILMIFWDAQSPLAQKIPVALTPILRSLIVIILSLLWYLFLIFIEKFFPLYSHSKKGRRAIQHILFQSCTWIAFGLSFSFLFPKIDFYSSGMAISVFALSWVVGYVAVFAPGGIGVREMVISFLLGNTLLGDPIIFATIHRFIIIAVELALGIFATFLSSLTPTTPAETSHESNDQK